MNQAEKRIGVGPTTMEEELQADRPYVPMMYGESATEMIEGRVRDSFSRAMRNEQNKPLGPPPPPKATTPAPKDASGKKADDQAETHERSLRRGIRHKAAAIDRKRRRKKFGL